MTERYIPGVPCWIDTIHPDPEAAADFYAGLFGWDCEDTMPAEVPGHYFMARIDGADVAAVGSVPDGAPNVAEWNSYIWVDDADATTKLAVDNGATVIAAPFDIFDAGRMAMLADPQGAVFGLWQPDQHRGAAKVNEHGTLNFNDLTTTDVDGAAAFYGAVFGWGVMSMGSSKFWTMTAYGDHLEELNPGMRKQMAEMGAPDFENVVASLGEAEPGQPARWGVTFAVDDIDVTAKTAVELGATIVTDPTDAPWVRYAIIQDPQGAVFQASQFIPENA